ncbi:rhodanese-like domain-containing protein [Mycobacterium talmoniae]|nr:MULTISPECIES: rhodanese-like domain-containing protein [Mycobacterium]OHU89885.1 sulfurtransferase [Mycobacterium talmoniae]TDH45419.1 rhodanese-like domain-containing protein [Mycobacterium eburneum]
MDDGAGVTQADVTGLPQSFQAPAATLLDVREHDEWQRGHAPDALHIPMGEVPSRLDELDRDGQLYVICHVGGRSQRVAQFLHANGYPAVNVSGGMLAWAAAGRPVITDDGRPGTV